MSAHDNGGPAFPTTDQIAGNGDHVQLASYGMSLRDYFAAKAMQAMVSKSCGQNVTAGKKGVPLVAKFAYEYADAMLKAREA